MFRNYLLVAFRNLFRNRISSLVNIIGLAIGMAAFVLIIQYVRFELSYDKFHENEENIYRIQQDRLKGAGSVVRIYSPRLDFRDLKKGFARNLHANPFSFKSNK
jgi:hypothetical protein